MLRGSGRSQEFIKKWHFIKNGSTKISVLEVRIDSMQHFFPSFCFWCTGFHWSLSGGMRQMHLSWFLRCKSSTVSPFSFCLYTRLWCYGAKDLSSCGWNKRTIHLSSHCPRREKATPGDFRCMSRPSVSMLLCGAKTSVGVWNRLSVVNLL